MPGHAYIAGVPLTKWTGQPPDAFKKHQESTPEADSIQKLACVIRKVSNLTWICWATWFFQKAVITNQFALIWVKRMFNIHVKHEVSSLKRT